jgi:hypothetical protein
LWLRGAASRGIVPSVAGSVPVALNPVILILFLKMQLDDVVAAYVYGIP